MFVRLVQDAVKVWMMEVLNTKLLQTVRQIGEASKNYVEHPNEASFTKALSDHVWKEKGVSLLFVCTHNSRRSHLSQYWAYVMATYFQIPILGSYSAGTEETAVYPSVIRSMEHSGAVVDVLREGPNPIYAIRIGEAMPVMLGFSKTISSPINPKADLLAVMTCTQADEACPYIEAAAQRISLPFVDPKFSDGTPEESTKYLEKSNEIAMVMYRVFSAVKK